MNQRIRHLLQNPFEVQLSDVALLQDEIEKYPYFSTLRTLLLFGLKEYEHASYHGELKKTSIYSPSRVALYQYLQKEKRETTKALEEEMPLKETQNPFILAAEPETSTPIAIDIKPQETSVEDIIEKEEELISEISPTEEQPETNVEISTSEAENSTTQTLGENPEKIETNTVETQELPTALTFSQWLSLSKNKPSIPVVQNEPKEKIEETKTDSTKPLNEKDIKFQLIEEFIEKSPKITPIKHQENPTPSEKVLNQVEYPDLMTETLAQIYTEQKKYDKAIRAYKILMLKYPEKEEIFTEKIEQIEAMKGN